MHIVDNNNHFVAIITIIAIVITASHNYEINWLMDFNCELYCKSIILQQIVLEIRLIYLCDPRCSIAHSRISRFILTHYVIQFQRYATHHTLCTLTILYNWFIHNLRELNYILSRLLAMNFENQFQQKLSGLVSNKITLIFLNKIIISNILHV